MWLCRNLRPLTHISERTAAASTRLYKIIPLLTKLRAVQASQLVKAAVIRTMTYSMEIFNKTHINQDQSALIKICLSAVAYITTGGCKKADTHAVCTEAGLPMTQNLMIDWYYKWAPT